MYHLYVRRGSGSCCWAAQTPSADSCWWRRRCGCRLCLGTSHPKPRHCSRQTAQGQDRNWLLVNPAIFDMFRSCWGRHPCVLSGLTCCCVVRPGSWYRIMLCSAVTVASLKEAGRRRRCVKTRGFSAFSSSSSVSSPAPFSFSAETPVRLWLKMQRAVLGSHTRSMPLEKKGGTWVKGT